MIEIPNCPWCGNNGQVYEDGDYRYWCRRCNRFFDEEPDESGDYSDFDPSARLEREEQRKARKRQS